MLPVAGALDAARVSSNGPGGGWRGLILVWGCVLHRHTAEMDREREERGLDDDLHP